MEAVADRPMNSEQKKVLFASSLGTVFEWYDFYLYGSLATFITQDFFSGVNETTGNIYFGLWYPVMVAAVTAVVGFLFVREMNGAAIED